MEISVPLSGMHCQACVGKITTAVKRLVGVESVEVSLQPPMARLPSDRPVSPGEIDAAVWSAGDCKVAEAVEPAPMPAAPAVDEAERGSFYPLLLIIGYIAGTVAVVAWSNGSITLPTLMSGFMGGFFLVFSFFKLLDLRGFAMSYRRYDLVAAAWPTWGVLYPFVELSLGIAYVTNVLPWFTNAATLALMLVGAAGVLKALLNKRRIRCACLGTVLKLPLTPVTLAEDVVITVMAALMLILPHGSAV